MRLNGNAQGNLRIAYIAVLHYGAKLLYLLQKGVKPQKSVLAEKASVAQSIAKLLVVANRGDGFLE